MAENNGVMALANISEIIGAGISAMAKMRSKHLAKAWQQRIHMARWRNNNISAQHRESSS
jgi:hypothetical protein